MCRKITFKRGYHFPSWDLGGNSGHKPLMPASSQHNDFLFFFLLHSFIFPLLLFLSLLLFLNK